MKKRLLTTTASPAITLDPRLTIQDLEVIFSKLDRIEERAMQNAVLERLALLVKRDSLSNHDFKTADRIIALLKSEDKVELCVSVQEKYLAVKTLSKTFRQGDRFLDIASSIINRQIGEINKAFDSCFVSEKSLLLHSIKNSLQYSIDRHHVVYASIPVRNKLIKINITPIDTLQKLFEKIEASLGDSLSDMKIISFPGEGIISLFEQMLQAAKMNKLNVMFIYEDSLFTISPTDNLPGIITYYQAKVNIPVDLNQLILSEEITQRAA